MAFNRVSGTGAVGSVQITNTEIACDSPILTEGDAFIVALSIGGCTINITGTTSSNIGIPLFNINHFNIGTNIINALNGGSAVGIRVDSNCTNGKIAPQTYINLADANCLNNLSTTTFAETSRQTGTADLPAANTSLGTTLFTASVAVTFPAPFKVAPTVVCYPGSAAIHQVSCYPTSITKTGFTLVGVAATTGSVMTEGTSGLADGIV